ncbi:MAG: 7-carboxy-7-deazaguanine synthase QueE [Candidatus Marinarcus sp.]|uniref:7-carboxy-7-deazaguanine synthase QueE n=1 Tax=Candidatus Marinarcus sp. TaxID=3100987 RepID=UPI003AFF8146
MLEVTEIFGPTIQGEGKKIGTPSVFIRFGKCNMSCSGFEVEYETPSGAKKYSCDTYYAVDTAFRESWYKYNSHEEIIAEVAKLIPNNYKPDIVITGGEPLIYWKNEAFQKLLEYYVDHDFKVTIETNASLDIDFSKNYQKEILFSMSIKLSNSKEPLFKRINENTLTKIKHNVKEYYLKFVIEKQFITDAKKEIDDILKIIPQSKVYLMPRGDTQEEINLNAQAVIDMCVEYGFHYSDRLHIRLWDNKKGV